MRNYVRQQSAGEIIRNALEIFRDNFLVVFLAYFLLILPFIPVYINIDRMVEKELWIELIIAFVIYILLITLSSSVTTILISDICLGNKPNLLRSFKRVFSLKLLGKILWTGILLMVIVTIGLILFIIPGLIFMCWFMISNNIVILEGLRGYKALKRSKLLGKGYYMRNGGLYIFTVILSSLMQSILQILADRGLLFFMQYRAIKIFEPIIIGFFTIIVLIMFVLIYYDLRARKEGYDSIKLAEDLKH